MMKKALLALGAGSLLVAITVMASPKGSIGALPVESPGVDEDCYEWTYPKKDACGALSGARECKAEPTINSTADEKKREQCPPTKGDLCLCDE